MTPEQQKRLEELLSMSARATGGVLYYPVLHLEDWHALQAMAAEITRLREERDHALTAWRAADAALSSPTCTRVCQVPCCGQTILDRTPSGQIPCGDY
jgi:hypothetical protein